MAAITKDGKRRVLLINKRSREFKVSIKGANDGRMEFVDQITGSDPPSSRILESDKITLNGFAVAVVTLGKN
jgi:hypothetical protein